MFMQTFGWQTKRITVFSKVACINHMLLSGSFFFSSCHNLCVHNYKRAETDNSPEHQFVITIGKTKCTNVRGLL